MLRNPPEPLFLVAISGRATGGELHVQPIAGDTIHADQGTFLLSVDGGSEQTVALSEFSGAGVYGASWPAGQDVCLIGSDPGCHRADGARARVKLVVEGTLVWDRSFLVRPFRVLADGAVEVLCAGEMHLVVVDTDITYGAGGPDIPVDVALTRDGGAQVDPLFGGGPVVAGFAYQEHVGPGDLVGVRGHAAYRGFSATYDSFVGSDHVAVLVDGDEVPQVAGFDDQASVADLVEPFVDFTTGRISLANHEAILLWEFSSNLNGPAADFQDLVVLLRFPDGCVAA